MVKIKHSKAIAVVQCTAADLYESRNPDDYCISTLKRSGLFDAIVLASPKIGDYSVFDKLSRQWGVDVFYGHNFNVAQRLYHASRKYNPKIVVRVLLKRFYMDVDLASTMIEYLNARYDYINLSRDVNYEVAADVMSFEGLRRAVDLLETLPDDFTSNAFRFSPWVFMEEREEFNVLTLDYRCMWDRERITAVKAKLAALFGREENKQHVDIDNPASRYRFVSRFIEEGDRVLDIACGQGEGTVVLSERAREVYGIDSNENYIDNNRSQYGSNKIHFLNGTDELLESLNVNFDKIVSLHTLEHVEDDRQFLKRMNDRLKASGKLILEVPRLLRYPLGEPLYPVHKREYEREKLEGLLESTGFEVEVALGGNRGNYVDIEDAKEVLFYVCRKAAA